MNDINPEIAQSKEKYAQKRQKKAPKKITERYLRNAGLYYLERFTASSGHFKTVMTRKINKSCFHHKDQDREACLELLDKVTSDLLKQGYLNDKGYIRGMVTSLRRSGKSKKAITAKLIQKSVPINAIEKAIMDYDTEMYENQHEAEFLSALKFAKKKRLGPYDNREKYTYEKALSTLSRNGYNFETARRVLNLDPSELDDLEYNSFY